jgi:uncharacterized repeat protein (TIGR02543 family)
MRAGHSFVGWFTALNGGTQVFSHTVVQGNTTIFARWIVTITLNPSGGTVNPTSVARPTGMPIGNLPTPTRTGYIFMGWYTTLGIPITTSTIVQNNNMIVLARWLRIINMNYEILVNTNVTFAQAQSYVDASKSEFLRLFGILLIRQRTQSLTTLDERYGCERLVTQRCNVDCGELASCAELHHRSGNHFLTINPGSRSRSAFRFVDFTLCSYQGNGRHITVNGLANRILGDDILVTSRSDNARRTTAHEISHLFGARDGGCTASQRCVMRPGDLAFREWCDAHRAQILEYRNNR